ncbi:MAG: F0F1 ATP synthase subunit delta [Legionella sp.]
MSDSTTIARPYAKAIFEHASNAQQLGIWSTILAELSFAVSCSQASMFISSPGSTIEQKIELLSSVLINKNRNRNVQAVDGFVRTLAYNKRLQLLPEIAVQYELMKAEQEKTLLVKVISYSELNHSQQKKLIQALAARLQRQITLDIHLDKSLLGGAIIHAGDLVIDGSVRGKLNKLGTDLAA